MRKVDRLILDANYFRTITVRELELLRSRGLSICIDWFVLQEVWANAFRDQKHGRFFGPLRRIAPYLHPATPVLLGAGYLSEELRATTKQERNRRAFNHVRLGREMLATVLTNLDAKRFDAIAAVLELDLNEHGGSWTQTRASSASLELDCSDKSEPDLIQELIPLFHREAEATCPHRFDAYFRVAAMEAIRSTRSSLHRKPLDNDAEDLLLLMQLARGAFIATYDLRLLELVDESGSYQAPWIRTLGELLTDDRTTGASWGAAAMRKSRSFHRRSRKDLVELDRVTRSAGKCVCPAGIR